MGRTHRPSRDRAIPLLDEAVTLGRSVHGHYLAGVALVSSASLHGRHRDPHQALQLFREVIEHWHRLGNWTQQWTTVRNVTELLTRLGADRPAAVLHGAATTSTTAAPLFGSAAERLQATARTLRQLLGPATFDHATTEGAKLGDDAAIAHARTAIQEALADRTPS